MAGDPALAPRYVVATGGDATTVLRRLARAGWTTREGFALTDQQWDVSDARLALFGRVADADTAELALLAAARGAGIVAISDAAGDIGRALLADLGRIGPVATDPDADLGTEAEPAATGLQLAPEQRALLERLAGGETIAAAAAAEFLSLRTANRRIAEAREALGVRTTREAVLAYLRMRREGN
ncbi:LuxR family transcriptional regulator [Dactylosporangium sp. AC04546]|uniref:LuxR family transcriptional regulator n=1 Tax=Dactylosporangium sp. AC04546 TaxID=2862460 RepID=UPI001EE0A14C|nr:LuxR family transcriptional regulator [Dactylosporangium sp. AC04546]WVK78186.1 LuxR family transcriptional regulator [Dactylosporangium sp. AC04546]